MSEEAYNQVCNAPHKGHLTHDVLAAAAAWQAMKAWNEHQKKKGVDVSHATAKEFVASATAAFLTRVVETRGIDAYDHAKAKAAAKKLHDEQLDGRC